MCLSTDALVCKWNVFVCSSIVINYFPPQDASSNKFHQKVCANLHRADVIRVFGRETTIGYHVCLNSCFFITQSLVWFFSFTTLRSDTFHPHFVNLILTCPGFFCCSWTSCTEKKISKILQKTTTHPIQTIQHLSELSLIYFYVLIPTKKSRQTLKRLLWKI